MSKKITIEKASLNDVERLNDLYVLLTNSRSKPEDMKKTFSTFIDNDDYILLVVKIDDYVIGTGAGIVFRSLANDCRPYFVIDNVAIDPDYQHQGYGTMLFEKLHEYATLNNCFCAYLVAESDNVNAHKFYQKLGYIDEIIGFQKTF